MSTKGFHAIYAVGFFGDVRTGFSAELLKISRDGRASLSQHGLSGYRAYELTCPQEQMSLVPHLKCRLAAKCQQIELLLLAARCLACFQIPPATIVLSDLLAHC